MTKQLTTSNNKLILNNYESTPTAFPLFNPSFTNNHWSSPKLNKNSLETNDANKNDSNQNNENSSESSTPVKQFSTFQSGSRLNNGAAFSPLAEKKFFLNDESLMNNKNNTESPETLKIRTNLIKSPKLNNYTNKLPPVPKRSSKNTNLINKSKQALNTNSNLVDFETNQKLLLELSSRSNFNRTSEFDENDTNSLLTTMQLKQKLNHFYPNM